MLNNIQTSQKPTLKVLIKGGGSSGLSIWKTWFQAKSWSGRPENVPAFWGWFWVHAQCAQYCPCVRPRSEEWVQKVKPWLNEIELSYRHHSIRIEKTSILIKERQNRMKNNWIIKTIWRPNSPRLQLLFCVPPHAISCLYLYKVYTYSNEIWIFILIAMF